MTDPKNADYEMESGGTRNYEVWHDKDKTNKAFEEQAEEEEKMDSMKALENRVAESQREIAELDALEEIQAMNKRHVSLMKGGRKMNAAAAILEAREAAVGKVPEGEEDLNENGLTKDEEDLVSSIKFGAASASAIGGNDNIRRLDEEDEMLADNIEQQRREEAEAIMSKQQQKDAKKKSSNLPIFKVKKRKKKVAAAASAPEPKRAKTEEAQKKDNNSASDSDDMGSGGALGGLLAYGTDSS